MTKRKVLNISQKDDLAIMKQKGFLYKHFNYLPFYEADDIMGMWQRIFALCKSYQPHLILLKFEHDNCINDYELSELKKIGIVLQVYGATEQHNIAHGRPLQLSNPT